MRRAAAALALVATAQFATAGGAQQPTAARDSVRADSSKTARALNTVVVTASRRLQRVSDAAVTTEVISRADIERSGAQDLNALLTQFVGVQPEPSVAGSGGVQIEGLSSEHVLLLIDGQPMVGRIDGELDISRVPAWMIDHVEVIKGPLSTLYGSAAMGGVINVITRDALLNRPAMNASAVSGSQGRFDANGAIRGTIGDARGFIGFGRRQDDVQPGRDDQSGARANRWDGTGKVHWAPGESGATLDASVLGVREDQRWQSGQLYFFSDNDQGDARVTLQTPLGADARRLGVTGYYSQFNHLSRQATLPEPVSDSGDGSRESLVRLEVTYNGQLTATQFLDAGVDLDRDALSTGRIIGGHRTQTSVEPYAQYTMEAGQLSLVPGARLSHSDAWGTHFTPKIAALYHLEGGWALRASVGAGYRAPDFKELYITFLNSNVGYVVHGNPALQPETSTNATVGFEWNGANAFFRVQGYTNRFTNFIESVQVPDSGSIQQFSYGNIADGTTRGVDVDAGWTYRALSFDGSVGYLDAYDHASHLPLLGATPRSARLTTDLRLPMRARASLTGLYWSAAPASQESVAGQTVMMYRAPFSRMDARIARAFAGGIDAQAGVQNLFDARPTDWPGNTARRWYLGLSVDRGF